VYIANHQRWWFGMHLAANFPMDKLIYFFLRFLCRYIDYNLSLQM